jgi:hypothetical protein
MPVTACRRASEVFLRFGFHESMESTLWLPIQGHWNTEKGKLDLISPESSQYDIDIHSECMATSKKGPMHCPTTLAIGDALSVTASCMKYHEYTRAQIVPYVNADNVERVWQKTIAFLAQSVLTSQYASYFAVSARVVTIGCFVERVTSSQFSIGIITQSHEGVGVPGSASSQEIAAWCGASLENVIRSEQDILRGAEVPICRGYRQARMTVRAEVGAQQLVAGHIMPPIHVHCHFGEVRQMPPATASTAISCVKVFLLRPQDSRIQGHTVQRVGDAAERGNVDHFLPLLSSSIAQKPLKTHSRDHFVFEHLVVSAPGETLIGVECCIKEQYRPFVAPLLQWIPPFLVLPQ